MPDLSFSQMFALGNALAPMTESGEIQSALAELQKIEADPAVKAAILTAERYLEDPQVKTMVATLQKVAAAFGKITQGG